MGRAATGDLDGVEPRDGAPCPVPDRAGCARADERLRDFVLKMPHAVAMFDREMRYVAASGRYVAEYRLRGDDVAGRSHYEIFPEIPERWREIHRRCLAGATERSDGEPFQRADGSTQWVRWEIQPWHAADGSVGGLFLFTEDVTARKLDEERGRAEERKYRSLFESSLDAVYLTSTDGAVLEANPAACRLHGMTLEELRAAGRKGLVQSTSALARMIRERARRGQAEGVLSLRRKDGTTVPAEVESVVVDPRRNDWNTFVIARDITARVRAEEEQLRLQGELAHAQRLESVGRLAGGIAHDFNNLLTVILGAAEHLLAEAAAGRALSTDEVEEIRGAGRRAADLTRQLLTFARKHAASPAPITLNDTVRGMERLLRRVIGEHVELRVDLDPAVGSIHADPGQLELAIVNLAVNARDAMPGGGVLTLATRAIPAEAGAEAARGQVALVVRDTGGGIPPEVMPHLFEPFFTTKPPGNGTGLGLATVYGIVRQSGGDVTVRSEPGKGARFELRFPRCDEAASAPSASAVPRGVGGSETVLVVEDDPGVRQIARRTLAGVGYRVLLAPSGPAALSLLETLGEPPPLVVSDLVMPGMDGIELAERIRARHPEVRLLFVSGYDQGVVRGGPRALERDAEFLAKPFTPAALLAKVRAALDAGR